MKPFFAVMKRSLFPLMGILVFASTAFAGVGAGGGGAQVRIPVVNRIATRLPQAPDLERALFIAQPLPVSVPVPYLYFGAAVGLNNNGQILLHRTSGTFAQPSELVFVSNGTATSVLGYRQEFSVFGKQLNDVGQFVGILEDTNANGAGRHNLAIAAKVFRFDGASIVTDQSFSGITLHSINNQGWLLGSRPDPADFPRFGSYLGDHLILKNGVETRLVLPVEMENGADLVSINDAGEVIGAGSANEPYDYWWRGVYFDSGHNFSYLAGNKGEEWAQAINAKGQIVGQTQVEMSRFNYNHYAAYWENGRAAIQTLQPTPWPNGRVYEWAADINRWGQIVGHAQIGGIGNAQNTGVLWVNKKTVDLSTKVINPDNLALSAFNKINDDGVIVGVEMNYIPGSPEPKRTFVLQPVWLALSVDANRDGLIKFESEDTSDVTTTAQPFRFWINDDIDRIHTFLDSAADSMDTINETEQDDIGSVEAAANNWQADWKDNTANSRRDLEDFVRLQIHLTAGLTAAVKNGDLYLGVKWADTGGTTPAIKLYKQYDAAGDTSYLTDEFKASLQQPEPAILNASYANEDPATSVHTLVEAGDLFVLPQGVWLGLTGDSLTRTLLFEGCKPGKGQLKLVVLKRENNAYTEIGEGPGVWLDLKKIDDLYEHWTVGNASGGPPDAVAGRTSAEGGSGAFSYGADSLEERKYILFVHGWNMEKWEKERFAETAYKRLWWQGYKGRFGLFSWPCTNRFDETSTLGKIVEGVSDGTHFDRGEWTAWRTGAPMRQLLQTLSSAYAGELYVFSHSMGGIVVSEALRKQSDAGGAKIAKVYVASQAALPAHLFDGTLSDAVGSPNAVQWDYNHPSLPTGTRNYGPQTTNIYRNWFAFMLNGGGSSTSSVGALVNFYNGNDWALAAPAWQFNQITKPDWPDTNYGQPWQYAYAQDAEIFGDYFQKTQGDMGSNLTPLLLGNRTDPKDRHEIMSFAAESRVKAFGATSNLTQGVTRSLNLRSIWPANTGDHKAHTWHSAQFRSSIQKQKDYWKTLLDQPGFQIPTTTLP